MKNLFSFDDEEFQENLKNQKKPKERKNTPVSYRSRKLNNKEKDKIRKEFNQESINHFILPDGTGFCRSINLYIVGHGVMYISADKIVSALQANNFIPTYNKKIKG